MPSPLILKENIEGHIIEQNNPPLKKEYILTRPVFSMPHIIEAVASKLNTNNVFTGLSVKENLEIGAYLRNDDYSESLMQIFELFPILKEKIDQTAGELSGGQRQQLALGRALVTNPKLLLLDEPTAGVSPKVMEDLFNQIIRIRDNGVGILIVEQNARKALSVADVGYVLVNGENRYTGSGNDLLANDDVRRSFLGG